MDRPVVDPLSHTLGRVEQSLEIITKTLSEDRVASATYRTEMRREVSTVKDIVQDLKNRVNNNADELAEWRPDMEDFRKRRDKGLGMYDLTKMVWFVILGLATLGIGVITHTFWPTKPL